MASGVAGGNGATKRSKDQDELVNVDFEAANLQEEAKGVSRHQEKATRAQGK